MNGAQITFSPPPKTHRELMKRARALTSTAAAAAAGSKPSNQWSTATENCKGDVQATSGLFCSTWET